MDRPSVRRGYGNVKELRNISQANIGLIQSMGGQSHYIRMLCMGGILNFVRLPFVIYVFVDGWDRVSNISLCG